MEAIIAVGNAPSSGSTLLADLLDSLSFGVCGPEIRLFSVRDYFTRYESIRHQGIVDASCGSCYTTRMGFASSRLHCYGLDTTTLRRFLEEESSFDRFCQRIAKHFAVLRGKNVGMFFEKTPQNIQNARHFLETFQDSVFLHIVRDPLYVYRSLLNRGFPPYVAAVTWLIDEAAIYQLRKHPRLYTIRYEDLISQPYRTVAEFVGALGRPLDLETLRRSYRDNQYRRLYSGKLTTWKVREYGKVGNANTGEINKSDIAALRYMHSIKVSPGYAQLFGLSEASFVEVAAYHGYRFDSLLAQDIGIPQWPDRKSWVRLFRKWYLDFRSADASIQDMPSYLAPAEPALADD